MKRRRPAWVVAGVALVVIAAAGGGWPARFDQEPQARSAARAEPPPLPTGMRVVESFRLRPPGGGDARGVGVLGRLRGRVVVSVVAWGLRPLGAEDIYAVWLYNSREDALTLGGRRATDAGELLGTGPLPRRLRRSRRYRFLDVSVEPVRGGRGHSSDSVLRGRIGR